MAEIEFAEGIEGIHGTIGGLMIRRAASGKYYLSRVPDMSKVKASPAQRAHRQKFKQAAAYAKAALADPQVGEYYRSRAEQENKRARNLALSDGYHGIDRLKAR